MLIVLIIMMVLHLIKINKFIGYLTKNHLDEFNVIIKYIF
jgi:hypothetical protein